MTERQDHPNSSHFSFPYYFSDVDGINFQGITNIIGDLLIYYNGNNFIDCRCSRWDVQDYSVICETWLKKDDLQTLVSNIVPGGVKELYQILGRKFYYDQTWQSKNTIKLEPNIYTKKIGDNWKGTNTSKLAEMRSDVVCFPKTITTRPIEGSGGWIFTKINAYISGNQNL